MKSLEERASRFLGGLVPQREVSPSIAEYISDPPTSAHRLLSSKRWRKSRLDDYSSADMLEKLRLAAQVGVVRFSIPCGGYKGWSTPSCPSPDWAEVFFLHHLSILGNEIYATSGLRSEFSFSYTSGVLDLVSNYPTSWQEQYVSEFTSLLRAYSSNVVDFQMVDISELYPNRSDVREEIRQNVREHQGYWKEMNPDAAKRIASAERNLVPKGERDLSGLSLADWTREVLESAKLCEGLDSLERRRHFNKFGERIQLVLIRGPVPSLHIGSCRTSALHPWVGEGVGELWEDTLLPRIVAVRGRKGYRPVGDVPVSSPWTELVPSLSRLKIVEANSSGHGLSRGST